MTDTRARSRAREEADQKQAEQDAHGQEDAEIAQGPGLQEDEQEAQQKDEQEAQYGQAQVQDQDDHNNPDDVQEGDVTEQQAIDDAQQAAHLVQQEAIAAHIVNMAAVPAPAAVFGLRPSDLVPANEFVNYATVQGRQAYAFAIEPLDVKFDGETKNLRLFLKKVGNKARMNGWHATIMSIPVTTGAVVANRSLVTEYGLITLGDIRTHEITYAGQQVRATQDSANMVEFLNGSLSDELLLRVIGEASDYTFAGVENGPAMLHTVILLATTETRATVSLIQARIGELNCKTGELNSTITTFNKFVKKQISQLSALGEPVENMVSGYTHAPKASTTAARKGASTRAAYMKALLGIMQEDEAEKGENEDKKS